MRWSLLLVLIGGCFSKPPAPGATDGGISGGDGSVPCTTPGAWQTVPVALGDPDASDWSPSAAASTDHALAFVSDRTSLTSTVAYIALPDTLTSPTLIAGAGGSVDEVAWSFDGTALFVTDTGGSITKFRRLGSTTFMAGEPPTELSGLTGVHDLAFRSDGLEAWWSDGVRLHVATRASVSEPFLESLTSIDVINNGFTNLYYPTLSPDGLTLYFVGDKASGSAVYTSTRPKFGNAFMAPAIALGLPADLDDLDMDATGRLWSSRGELGSEVYVSARCP